VLHDKALTAYKSHFMCTRHSVKSRDSVLGNISCHIDSLYPEIIEVIFYKIGKCVLHSLAQKTGNGAMPVSATCLAQSLPVCINVTVYDTPDDTVYGPRQKMGYQYGPVWLKVVITRLLSKVSYHESKENRIC
jgi:hypothetical protein